MLEAIRRVSSPRSTVEGESRAAMTRVMLRWLLGLPREGTPIGIDGAARPCAPRDGGRGWHPQTIPDPERYRDGWRALTTPIAGPGRRARG